MKETIKLVIKGFLLGVANIIPGVSGGTLAITMGIYEDLISAISHFFKNFKKNIQFLLPLGIGIITSVLLMSKLISYCLDKFPFPTTLFFIGLIIGGIPLIARKVKRIKLKPTNVLLFLLTFGIIMAMTFLNTGNNIVSLSDISVLKMFLLFIVGMVAAATMVIPGVSGSFALMLLGYYKPIVTTISNLTNFNLLGHNLLILMPFGVGVLVGIVLIAKLIEFLFNKYEIPTYYAILGFVVSSVLGLGIGLIGTPLTFIQVIIGVVLFVLACIIGYKLGDE